MAYFESHTVLLIHNRPIIKSQTQNAKHQTPNTLTFEPFFIY